MKVFGFVLARKAEHSIKIMCRVPELCRYLDLERKAFVSLCGEPKTIERIKHMLGTGKPLRN